MNLHRSMELILPPPSVSYGRRSSIRTSSSFSTTDSSSPELSVDTLATVITPESEEDDQSDHASPDSPRVVPKIEELDESCASSVLSAKDLLELKESEAEDAKPAIVTLPVRKRGRPRKHPIVEPKKSTHARSKTGCGTCRRRKKKCDETKPWCSNCEKNNVLCNGYEPRQAWRSGREKTFALSTSYPPPKQLPLLVNGVESESDQHFLRHFQDQLGKVLSLTDNSNPFLDLVLPMAIGGHAGLMHSVLYLSSSCLIANNTLTNDDWQRRQEHHSDRSVSLLRSELAELTVQRTDSSTSIVPYADPAVAQSLILFLQTVCAGDRKGTYRVHLYGMKELLTSKPYQTLRNERLRQLILEFILYHDYSSAITSPATKNPLDNLTTALMNDFKGPQPMSPISTKQSHLVGVADGLFEFVSQIRSLRDRIRPMHRQFGAWVGQDILDEGYRIDTALRNWQCLHSPETPRYAASILYRICTWIYLERSMLPSRKCVQFQQAVDEGLFYLRQLPWEGDNVATKSIVLMPLFLLGCAAFEEYQRPEIDQYFERLQSWSTLGNIQLARSIVNQMWEMMDQGLEQETWEWEEVIAKRGWDFLVT